MLAVASFISMHSVSGVRSSRSFHSIASSFHQQPQLVKQECCAHLPFTAIPKHSTKSAIHFKYCKIEQHTYTQKIKKKAKVSGSPLGCKVKMHFVKNLHTLLICLFFIKDKRGSIFSKNLGIPRLHHLK